jgi:hypothetical protein
VFDCVIEVEYLDGGGEIKAGVFPDPGGTITEKDDDLRQSTGSVKAPG